MAPKRRKPSTKCAPRKRAKAAAVSIAPPIPKTPKPFPNEILTKVFRELDVITASSFRLVGHKFQDIYLEFEKEIFRYTPYQRPLNLEAYVRYPDGMAQTLKACLSSWMPIHIFYDCWAQKFVTLESLVKTTERIRGVNEELQLDKKAGREARKRSNDKKRVVAENERGDEELALEYEGDSDIEVQENLEVDENSDFAGHDD